eukprot:scaffold102074_cov18-Tisochrysis_lutea.AAC.1
MGTSSSSGRGTANEGMPSEQQVLCMERSQMQWRSSLGISWGADHRVVDGAGELAPLEEDENYIIGERDILRQCATSRSLQVHVAVKLRKGPLVVRPSICGTGFVIHMVLLDVWIASEMPISRWPVIQAPSSASAQAPTWAGTLPGLSQFKSRELQSKS